MTRWIHPPERARALHDDAFDPVAEGARHHLARMLALALWQRVRDEATDPRGRCDVEAARRRFGELATKLARHAAIGRQTRVERDASPTGAASSTALDASLDAVLGPPTIGRTTRVLAETMPQMERAFGRKFDDVELHPDSPEVPVGSEAFTRGRHIHFESGALDRDHGELVLAHELAHVAQQDQPRGRAAPRAALETEAHHAALAAVAGHAANVNLHAPASAVLGFSRGGAPASSSGSAKPSKSSGSPSKASTPSRSSRPAAPAPNTSRAPSPRSGATRSKTTVPAAAPASGRRGTDGLLVPEAPTTLTPAAAGRMKGTQTGNVAAATATTTLPTAQQQTTVAREAVVEPQAEQDAHAQHDVVTAVDDRPPPSPEIEAACARIRQVIRDKRPVDENKLGEAKPREMAQQAGEEMTSGVEQRAGSVREGYAGMQQTPQGTPTTTPVPATLPPTQVATPSVDGGAGAPDAIASEDVSLDGDVAAQQQKIEDAGMNTEPGRLVKDGPIGDARGGADELQNLAKTDPQQVLAQQATAIADAKGDMVALQAAAHQALADARAGAVSDMAKHTTGVKGSEEQQRAEAGERMKGVFTRTQQTVDKLLQPLAGNAVARWEAGVAQLSSAFEAALGDVKAEIDDRHSGALGWVREHTTDAVFGLPAEITAKYDAAETKFADGATSLIRDISRDVNAVIADCKKLIELARKEIDDIVRSLPANLQAWAKGEAAKLGAQLDQLDQRVDQTQKGLNQDLINRANTAVDEVRQRVAQLREAAKGMLAKIADAITEFLKDPFKAIVNGLLRVVGIDPGAFWGLVDKLGNVVRAIAQDPLKFANTLISGTAKGFSQFFGNFMQHMGQVLMDWLFGTMSASGVPMPTDFSGPGIMVTVLGVLGIDGGFIGSMLGADLQDPEERAEAQQELSGALAGGPMGIVNLIKAHFDPSSVVAMLKDAAIQFLVQTIITKVAIRIAMLFNPAGAILQAIEAIFRVLMWVFNNAARIFTLIETLVSAAGLMVAGNVAGVANLIESALTQIIVLVIDFLAGYLGVGGLPGKLRGIITKLRGKVDGALKKVLDAIKKRAKARAKAKHKPKAADKKAGPDKKAGDKADDRDAKKAKDDAKDPRNHMRDPDDDKDPRNHAKDDDNDPAKKRKDDDYPKKRKDHDRDPKKAKDHDDDKDPKKKKDDDEDEKDPKKKKDHDLSEARRAARAAASRGWTAARNATEREVQAKPEVKLAVTRAEHSTPKIKIDLDVEDRGDAWTVQAKATVGTAHATDTEGKGWIARGDGNRPWYAARDLRPYNRRLIERGFEELKHASSGARTAADAHALYDLKVQQGKQVRDKLQQELDGEIRGLRVGIDMESWAGAERDALITTKISVAPNSQEGSAEVPDGAVNFKPIHKTAAMAGGSEQISIIQRGQKLFIVHGGDASVKATLDTARSSVFRTVRNRAGAMVIEDAIKELWEAENELAEIDASAPVSTEEQARAERIAQGVVRRITAIGRTLDVATLERTTRIDRIPDTLDVPVEIEKPEFPPGSLHDQQFDKEVERQVRLQERGVNKQTLDVWVSQIDMFRAGTNDGANWLSQLGPNNQRAVVNQTAQRLAEQQRKNRKLREAIEQLEKLKPKLDMRKREGDDDEKIKPGVALADITSNTYITNNHMERHGNEGAFRRTHRAGIAEVKARLMADWDVFKANGGVQEVILHNQDQVFGGFGKLPDIPTRSPGDDDYEDYLDKLMDYVGAEKINSEIGTSWPVRSSGPGSSGLPHWQDAYVALKASYPHEGGHPLWRMNVSLRVVYLPVGTKPRFGR